MKDKIFVVPQNDLESVAIVALLKEQGYKVGEDLFITKQGWGASWEALEPEIRDAIAQHDPSKVYGVELKGKSPYNNVDHHDYCDKNWSTGEVLYEEKRSILPDGSPAKSSLEQVAILTDTQITRDMAFIAANDVGFVDEMMRLGKEYGMTPEEIADTVLAIRMREHTILSVVQGITAEMEQQAEEAIKNAHKLPNGTMVVNLPHSRCATVTDRLPMQEYEGGLLIVCGDGETDYYGPSENVQSLASQFGGWSGNTQMPYTFWGSSDGSIQSEVVEAVAQFEPDRGKDEVGDDAI